MCGRFTLIRLSDFTDLFPWILPPDAQAPPRHNIAPTQAVAVVPNLELPKIDYFHWGLIPAWATERRIGNKMINARAESLAERPSFRTALRRRRCLIPADGFYEWRVNPGMKKKTPMHFRMKDSRPFAFAGLWDVWRDAGGSEVPSCTIITTSPNELVRPVHDRMPAILPEEDYRRWLDPRDTAAENVLPLLRPYAAERMEAAEATISDACD